MLPLPRAPPVRRGPLSLVSPRAPWSSSASFFARKTKLGRTIPRRPSGPSTSPPNWRRHKPTGPSSGPNSPLPTPGSPVGYFIFRIVPLFSNSSSDFFISLVLESQIQTLHAAAATATESVNARGDTVATRLQDIPNCVREIARHGVHHGAAIALVTAQFETGHDLLQVEPVQLPLGGEDWWIFLELIDDMEMAAAAITEDVSIEAVIGNVFADD